MEKEMLSQSEILELGWTKTMISKFLPEPTLKQNPYYRKAAPMKLWNKQVVMEVMETEEFCIAMERANKRKAAANKAVETKTKALVDEMTDIGNKITIKIIPDDALRRRTIASKEEWYMSHDSECYGIDLYNISTETMERWIVNYIRHNLVKYDKSLKHLYGRVGRDDAYWEFKRIVLERIALAYPDYSEECQRQIAWACL